MRGPSRSQPPLPPVEPLRRSSNPPGPRARGRDACAGLTISAKISHASLHARWSSASGAPARRWGAFRLLCFCAVSGFHQLPFPLRDVHALSGRSFPHTLCSAGSSGRRASPSRLSAQSPVRSLHRASGNNTPQAVSPRANPHRSVSPRANPHRTVSRPREHRRVPRHSRGGDGRHHPRRLRDHPRQRRGGTAGSCGSRGPTRLLRRAPREAVLCERAFRLACRLSPFRRCGSSSARVRAWALPEC